MYRVVKAGNMEDHYSYKYQQDHLHAWFWPNHMTVIDGTAMPKQGVHYHNKMCYLFPTVGVMAHNMCSNRAASWGFKGIEFPGIAASGTLNVHINVFLVLPGIAQ